MSDWNAPFAATSPTLDARLEAAAKPVMQRDLCLLTAHLLLHILEIDRKHARQRGRTVETQSRRNDQ